MKIIIQCFSFFLAAALLLNCASIFQNTIEIQDNQREPVTPQKMAAKLLKAAEDYEAYAPVPRIAIYEIVFGASIEEHIKLGGYGVLMITSVNLDPEELPIKRAYFKSEEGKHDLKLLKQRKVPLLNEKVNTVFGANRMDSYYLYPHRYTQAEGELRIDWQINRKNFVLFKEPAGHKAVFQEFVDFNQNIKSSKLDEAFLKQFVLREFKVKVK